MHQKTGDFLEDESKGLLMPLNERVILKHFKRNRMYTKFVEEDEIASALIFKVCKLRKLH